MAKKRSERPPVKPAAEASEEREKPKEDGDDKKQPPWVTIALALIGTVSAIVVALIQLYGKDDKSDVKPDSQAVTGAPSESAKGEDDPCLKLIWAPSKCPGDSPPAIGLGSCTELRNLQWLGGELVKLRAGALRGFTELGPNPHPRAEDGASRSGAVPNQKLAVDKPGGGDFLIGVGYHYEKNTDDGYLRLYNRLGQVQSDPVCMTKSGAWKVLRGETWAKLQ